MGHYDSLIDNGRVTCVTAYQQAAASPAARPSGSGVSPGEVVSPRVSPAVDAVPVLIKRLDQGLPVPARAHPGDAGVDLRTAVDVVLAPGERALVPTGMAIALPEGYAAFVHPRSGLAARHGVTIVNAPGTVDAGYRGEIKVTLLNTDRVETVRFERGDRIAQLVIQRVARPQFHEVETLPGSARGDGGFGSTGGHGSVTEEPGCRPSGGSRGVAPPGKHGQGGDESPPRQ
jgi:dUTP pyrophosphatase